MNFDLESEATYTLDNVVRSRRSIPSYGVRHGGMHVRILYEFIRYFLWQTNKTVRVRGSAKPGHPYGY